ncbi:MAG: undecaprenyl-diphosphate phosphatase, partial [Armatimonadota bacterium]|nr:undecaprenyl-diphosphate phosphatase [Armatimonadota bacterium]
MDFVKALLLALVEGVTEFLPISSTGHMILVEEHLRLSSGERFANAFMVVIQLPAVLAVVVYFWRELWPFAGGERSAEKTALWGKILAAFLPAAVLGAALDDFIEAHLFNPLTVSLALIAGGIALLALERGARPHRYTDVREIP